MDIHERTIASHSGRVTRLLRQCYTARYDGAWLTERELLQPAKERAGHVLLEGSRGGRAVGAVYGRGDSDEFQIRSIGVVPGQRRQRYASKLLEAIVAKVGESASVISTSLVDSRNEPAVRLLETSGFQEVADTRQIHMCARLADADLPISMPVGYTMRTYRPGDDRSWLRIHWEAFHALGPGARPWSAERFRKEFLEDPHFEPGRLFFACCAGEPVGTVSAWRGYEEGQEVGIVHWIAVHPAHQGKGLGIALLHQCMNRLREDGWETVHLSTRAAFVSARAMYERLKFKTLYQHARFRRLPQGGSGGAQRDRSPWVQASVGSTGRSIPRHGSL